MDINGDILENRDYAFLKENPLLKDNILLLTLGGSHAYGTNVETSDIDCRGITYVPVDSLLGNGRFEQFEDRITDTVIYGLNKIFGLLLNCNPNVIEQLGCKPEHYFMLNDDGRKLIENRKIFLSKRAIYSFGGYANAQLRRLQNALARDSLPQSEKEKHIMSSIQSAVRKYNVENDGIIQFNDSKRNVVQGASNYINLILDKSDREDMDTEIYMDVCLKHYPLRDYRDIWNTMNTVVKDYDKLGKRNRKKDDRHLNNHAQHLVRLHLMCIDILEKEEIITYREKDHDLLMSIKKGEFQKSDGSYRSEFFELVDELQKKMDYASEHTNLPELPDIKTANEMLIEMNMKRIQSLKGGDHDE